MARGELYSGWLPSRFLSALSRLSTVLSALGACSLSQSPSRECQSTDRRNVKPMPMVCAITGLESEARIARRTAARAIAVGSRPGAAADAARRLVESGADALVSFGLAGALD